MSGFVANRLLQFWFWIKSEHEFSVTTALWAHCSMASNMRFSLFVVFANKRDTSIALRKKDVSGNRRISSFVSWELQIPEINFFNEKNCITLLKHGRSILKSNVRGKNSAPMISKWATLHLLLMCGVYCRRKIMPQVIDFWNRGKWCYLFHFRIIFVYIWCNWKAL